MAKAKETQPKSGKPAEWIISAATGCSIEEAKRLASRVGSDEEIEKAHAAGKLRDMVREAKATKGPAE